MKGWTDLEKDQEEQSPVLQASSKDVRALNGILLVHKK
jgi:hypothetical protein